MNGETGTDREFHNNEGADIFALYSACNGKVRPDGLLDKSELAQYSPDEAKALNVTRLEEVWRHTRDCSKCASIVRILNDARPEIAASYGESLYDERAETADANANDSI